MRAPGVGPYHPRDVFLLPSHDWGVGMSQDAAQYQVVINHEEQYSLWPAQETPPQGWRAVGVVGSQEECLEHIERVWTDMRPLSLRQALEQAPA